MGSVDLVASVAEIAESRGRDLRAVEAALENTSHSNKEEPVGERVAGLVDAYREALDEVRDLRASQERIAKLMDRYEAQTATLVEALNAYEAKAKACPHTFVTESEWADKCVRCGEVRTHRKESAPVTDLEVGRTVT